MRYARGQGVKRDLVAALAWMSRAADQGLARAVTYRDALLKELSPEQSAAAEKLRKGEGR